MTPEPNDAQSDAQSDAEMIAELEAAREKLIGDSDGTGLFVTTERLQDVQARDTFAHYIDRLIALAKIGMWTLADAVTQSGCVGENHRWRAPSVVRNSGGGPERQPQRCRRWSRAALMPS